VRRYDLVIIGKGAAAFAAAIKASELSEGKASILMVGKGPLGGTCVNVGCVPSKYLLELSHRYFYARNADLPGIKFGSPSLDFSKTMGAIRSLVQTLREEKYHKVIANYSNVEVVDGTATFTSPRTVLVETDGRTFEVEAGHYVVATGSRPSVPPIAGIDKVDYVTSDTIWQLDQLPPSTVVIGGGAIGLELGQALRHFGSQVVVVEALPRIIYPAEPEMSQALQSILEQEGITFYLRSRVASIQGGDGLVRVEVMTKRGRAVVEGSVLLVATGRRPNTEGLGLDKAGVQLDEKGAIKVDGGMRTSNPLIYAAGDVVSKNLMLETLAAREGAVAAINIFGGHAEMDYLSTPWVVFTHPNLAAVGLSENEVTARIGACTCRVIDLKPVAKAHILGETKGLAKLILNPRDGRIMGAQVLAPYAAEFITEVALAMRAGMTYKDLIDTTHVFPTMSEVVKMTAQAFIRDIGAMSCCVE
jgi:mercuric reductase